MSINLAWEAVNHTNSKTETVFFFKLAKGFFSYSSRVMLKSFMLQNKNKKYYFYLLSAE